MVFHPKQANRLRNLMTGRGKMASQIPPLTPEQIELVRQLMVSKMPELVILLETGGSSEFAAVTRIKKSKSEAVSEILSLVHSPTHGQAVQQEMVRRGIAERSWFPEG